MTAAYPAAVPNATLPAAATHTCAFHYHAPRYYHHTLPHTLRTRRTRLHPRAAYRRQRAHALHHAAVRWASFFCVRLFYRTRATATPRTLHYHLPYTFFTHLLPYTSTRMACYCRPDASRSAALPGSCLARV